MNYSELIATVKKYPVLYDFGEPLYRDLVERNKAWREVAMEMNTSVEQVKEKWNKLRNCLTNAIKRRVKKRTSANKEPWKYEKEMEFLLPHIRVSHTKYVDILKYDDDILNSEAQDDSEIHFETEYLEMTPKLESVSSGSAPSSPKRRRDSETKPNYELLRDMNENDCFFLSMSNSLKKLSQRDQVEIKFKVHKLIHDAEMKMLNTMQEE